MPHQKLLEVCDDLASMISKVISNAPEEVVREVVPTLDDARAKLRLFASSDHIEVVVA